MSDTVQQTAVKKAIALLTAAGAGYTIRFGDETMTNQPVKTPVPRAKLKGIYQPWLDRLETESVIKVKCPEGQSITNVRGALCSGLHKKFGPGNTITRIDHATNSIEILRA